METRYQRAQRRHQKQEALDIVTTMQSLDIRNLYL